MATLQMRVGDAAPDNVSPEPNPSVEHGGPDAPGGSSFWRARRERFLTIFAVATVMTVPSLAVLFVGSYFENNPIVWFGSAMLVVAVIAWWVAYAVVARWVVADVAVRLRRWWLKSRR